jgi:hypothetical protein
LPGAVFNSREALLEFVDYAKRYEDIVAKYEATHDDLDLWEDLRTLGFGNEEIERHAREPGYRLPVEYVN